MVADPLHGILFLSRGLLMPPRIQGDVGGGREVSMKARKEFRDTFWSVFAAGKTAHFPMLI